MKKIIAFVLVAVLSVFAFASCGGNTDDTPKAMTHAEYVAAGVDKEVTVETYIQAKQGWWEEAGQGKATFYTQDRDGGYLLYNMPCTEEEYNKLTVGTKIRVKGYTAEFSGQYEIIEATYEIIENDTYVAQPTDVTAKLGTDDLIDYQTMYTTFKGLTIAAKTDADGNECAYFYGWNNAGSEGGDLYFDATCNGEKYTFVVESYLTGASSDVYQAVKNLKVGDTVDLTGYLYWYEGPQAHIVNVTVAD